MSTPFPADSGRTAERVYRRATVAVLAVAAILRVVLAWKEGAQFFFPDESRYNESRTAVIRMAGGEIGPGLAAAFEGGDHAGFKFLGLLPAGLERVTGPSDRLAALFFAAFSLGVVWLLGRIARQLGAPPAGSFWVTLAAAASATLFYYSRHLLPYDAALFFSLLALHLALGTTETTEKWRLPLAGFCAGAGAFIYYGYWQSAALALGIGLVREARSWRNGLWRCALAGAGAMLPLAGALAINQAWGNGRFLAKAREFSATITSGGDYRGSTVPLEFLARTEGLWFLGAAGATLAVAWALVCRRREALPQGTLWAAGGLGMLWLSFVITGDVMHKFVVYGRLARQLTPYFCLMLGLQAAAWLATRPRGWSWAVAVALALNAGWFMGQALTLEYPGPFYRKWEPVIAKQLSETPAADSYLRFVNVTEYIFEPQVLEASPLETLAAEDHAFSFVPYLYEGFSPAQRRFRQAIDHRMRVVRVAVPPAERITGESTGAITLDVEFPAGRAGLVEPLLSIGQYQTGCLFFVQYLTEKLMIFGCEVMGQAVFRSEPMEIQPGRHEIRCFSGALELGPDAPPSARSVVWLAIDGREGVLRRAAAMAPATPNPVYAGVNVIGADSAGSRFHGRIFSARRGGLPPAAPGGQTEGGWGALQLAVSPPVSRSNRPEPLLVIGEPGRAVLGFMTPLADGRVTLGAEVWGRGAWRSAPVTLRAETANEIVYEFGSLLPVPGDPAWGNTPRATQTDRYGRLRIWVNGQRVLETEVQTPVLRDTTVVIGRNPLGGSLVDQAYSGVILKAGRLSVVNPGRPDPAIADRDDCGRERPLAKGSLASADLGRASGRITPAGPAGVVAARTRCTDCRTREGGRAGRSSATRW